MVAGPSPGPRTVGRGAKLPHRYRCRNSHRAGPDRYTRAGMAVSTLVADRFELLAEAGKGAMGSVHRARDRKTGNLVAVKILILDRDLDVGRFGREATLLSQLHHPNIVGYV